MRVHVAVFADCFLRVACSLTGAFLLVDDNLQLLCYSYQHALQMNDYTSELLLQVHVIVCPKFSVYVRLYLEKISFLVLALSSYLEGVR